MEGTYSIPCHSQRARSDLEQSAGGNEHLVGCLSRLVRLLGPLKLL